LQVSHEPALSPGAPTAPSVRVALKLPVATVNNGSTRKIARDSPDGGDGAENGHSCYRRLLTRAARTGRSIYAQEYCEDLDSGHWGDRLVTAGSFGIQ